MRLYNKIFCVRRPAPLACPVCLGRKVASHKRHHGMRVFQCQICACRFQVTRWRATYRYRAKAPGFTREDVEFASLITNERCVYCGAEGPLFGDHIVPPRFGGLTHRRNLAPACGSCNSSKAHQDVDWWLVQRFGAEALRAFLDYRDELDRLVG